MNQHLFGLKSFNISTVFLLAAIISLLADATTASELKPFDLNTDGIVDVFYPIQQVSSSEPGAPEIYPPAGIPADRDSDGQLEFENPFHLHQPNQLTALPGITFTKVWDSGTSLNTIWTIEAGDADMDGVFDFAGGTWNPNVIHLFESTGGGNYSETWNSAGNTPPGVYRDITFGDTDGDGLGEILGAEVSTLGKIMLFEESGDGFVFVHDTVRESDFSGAQRLRSVLIGDTNQNGLKEIIVAAGGSNPTNGLISIWEHNGVIGDNTYTKIYEYTTVSYLFNATLGDSDNDGYPEIILGLGGMGGNPLIIRRIEFNTDQSTWIHQIYTSSVVGLPVTPHVGDFDNDGENELAYGSSGFLVIYENTAENSYSPSFTSETLLDGNLMSLADHYLTVPDAHCLAAGSFEGDVAVWGYDDNLETYNKIFLLEAIGGAVRGLALADDENDGTAELLPAIAGPVDQIQVFRQDDTSAVEDQIGSLFQSVIASPNPMTERTTIQTSLQPTSNSEVLHIHNSDGRLVKTLNLNNGTTRWDRRDDSGRYLPSGVYFMLQLHEGDAQSSGRLVLIR